MFEMRKIISKVSKLKSTLGYKLAAALVYARFGNDLINTLMDMAIFITMIKYWGIQFPYYIILGGIAGFLKIYLGKVLIKSGISRKAEEIQTSQTTHYTIKNYNVQELILKELKKMNARE